MVCWDLAHSYKPGALYTTKHRVMYLFILNFNKKNAFQSYPSLHNTRRVMQSDIPHY